MSKNTKKLGHITTFDVVNAIILTIIAVICIVPFINTLALSFSSRAAASTGTVTLWPKDFTASAYGFVLKKSQFWMSLKTSVLRVVIGTLFNLAMLILSAYPLSRPRKDFRAQPFFMWYMFIPMIFSGGLIPTYMIVRDTGIINTIWSMILPVGLPVFNMILLMNFFKEIPYEIDEAAFVDGANHWQILFKITLPLSKPSLATVTLLVFVFHWNSWFDGMIYTTDVARYPLQTYIRSITTLPDVSSLSMDQIKLLQLVSDKTMRGAQIVICCIPILFIYLFLQRYFVKGLVLGSVKG